MHHLKPCAICRQAVAKYTCSNCGALVCESCYDKGKGLCLNCAQGKR